MKNLYFESERIKTLIRLIESEPSIHYKERISDRYRDNNIKFLKLYWSDKKNDERMNVAIVGTYRIEKDIIDEINNRLKIIESINFPKDKIFGVILYSFFIDETDFANIRYYKTDIFDGYEFVCEKIEKYSVDAQFALYDGKTKSNGNFLLCIIENNILRTIEYAFTQTIYKRRERFDELISFKELVKKYQKK